MQTKLKISAILLTLLLAIMPPTVITAKAQTFDLHIPSFGLYCENQNADIHGTVKYAIDESGNAVQDSEYTVNATDGLSFISNAYELPEIDLTVNGKAVTGNVCYGENYLYNDELRFYSTDIEEDVTGTLYTLTAKNKSLTVDFKTYGKQKFISLLPYDRFSQTDRCTYSYTIDHAQSTDTYAVFAINGEFERFESNADVVKESLTLKEYIDRTYNELIDFYGNCGNLETVFFYALANKMLDEKNSCEFYDFFFESISVQRVNAYKIEAAAEDKPCTIAYSMPVHVQKNGTLHPVIYLTEQTATGNYGIDYTIELNSALPYVVESSAGVEKQNDHVYTVQGVTDDFYFVFSSSDQPVRIDGDNRHDSLIIVICVLSGLAVLAVITASIFIAKRCA